MKKYIVFWLPTIFHQELQIKKREIINTDDKDGFFDLSDESLYPYYAKFTLSENNNIIISSKVSTLKGEVSFDTILTLEDKKRKNGFMQFSLNEDEVPNVCRKSFILNLTNSMYHLIKEFFHEHECHTGKDGDLHPEVSPKPIDLESDDNPALMKCLIDFSDLFCKNAETVSELNAAANLCNDEYDRIRQKIKELPEELSESAKREIKRLHKEFLDKIFIINKLCENSLIEYTYCKTLLSSIYNKSFKHDVAIKPKAKDFEIKNAYRRRALNIRNSVRYIENIKYKNQNRQNTLLYYLNEDMKNITATVQEQSNKIDRIAISLAIYGVLFSLLANFKDIMGNAVFGVSLFILTFLLVLFMLFDMPKHLIFWWKHLFKNK